MRRSSRTPASIPIFTTHATHFATAFAATTITTTRIVFVVVVYPIAVLEKKECVMDFFFAWCHGPCVPFAAGGGLLDREVCPATFRVFKCLCSVYTLSWLARTSWKTTTSCDCAQQFSDSIATRSSFISNSWTFKPNSWMFRPNSRVFKLRKVLNSCLRHSCN